jgi:hypothetical protein
MDPAHDDAGVVAVKAGPGPVQDPAASVAGQVLPERPPDTDLGRFLPGLHQIGMGGKLAQESPGVPA